MLLVETASNPHTSKYYGSSLVAFLRMSCQSRASFVSVLLRANIDKTSFSKSRFVIPATVGVQPSSLPGRQYMGPNSSLINSSPFPRKPSSAIFLAYTFNACLYSCGLSSNFVACSFVSKCPRVRAILHHSGFLLSADISSGGGVPLTLPSTVDMMPRFAARLVDRWRPCQASEPSAHHRSLILTHVESAASYE